ncbi:MAG: hypothetical protein K1X81_14240 [Bacteroidia bacterium]|nr:hypothetical protein [Bacteroidia bacterium]
MRYYFVKTGATNYRHLSDFAGKKGLCAGPFVKIKRTYPDDGIIINEDTNK